jgi:hypothetical protein
VTAAGLFGRVLFFGAAIFAVRGVAPMGPAAAEALLMHKNEQSTDTYQQQYAPQHGLSPYLFGQGSALVAKSEPQ